MAVGDKCLFVVSGWNYWARANASYSWERAGDQCRYGFDRGGQPVVIRTQEDLEGAFRLMDLLPSSPNTAFVGLSLKWRSRPAVYRQY
jgi:hypothetical protein